MRFVGGVLRGLAIGFLRSVSWVAMKLSWLPHWASAWLVSLADRVDAKAQRLQSKGRV